MSDLALNPKSPRRLGRGVIANWNLNLGPRWYPIALAISGRPLCWLGGVLATRGRGA